MDANNFLAGNAAAIRARNLKTAKDFFKTEPPYQA